MPTDKIQDILTPEKSLEYLIKIGLTEPIEQMIQITDEPKIPAYYCIPNKMCRELYDDTEDVHGQGSDLDNTIAKVKAIGEVLERLCLYNPIKNNLVSSKYNPRSNFVDPKIFLCYSDDQVYPQTREDFIRDARNGDYRWYVVNDIISGEKLYVPAQLIFLNSMSDDEFQIRPEHISTGTALGGIGSNRAIISGFMESIERDACIYSYLSQRKIKKIVDFPEDISKLVKYLERYLLEVNVFDVTTDLDVPTAMTITIDHSGIGCTVNAGSKSHFDFYNAIKYSILESVQCRSYARLGKELYYSKKLPDENEIASISERFFYWYSLERIKDLDFWLENPQIVRYGDLENRKISFENAVNNLKSRGFHILVADITLPEIREGGFEVLKVMIPELHPLFLDEKAKMLFSTHYGNIEDNKKLKPHPLT